jgi:hypothetical protein
VLGGGLTLADQQRDRFPDLLPFCERLYPVGSYGAVRSGVLPGPIIPGDKRALNKCVVEALVNQCYSRSIFPLTRSVVMV